MKPEARVWYEQGMEHWQDAQYLFQGSRYAMSVYCCHQALEKLLKACLVELADTLPPKSHNLDLLARQAGLDMSEEWLADLAEITRHFWRVRYPDYQQHVYTTREHVEPTYTKTQELVSWITTRLNHN